MITYYVSGDEDIEPSGQNLRDSGRTVKHGGEIDREMVRAFAEGGRFVVVAHGDEAGTVFYCSGVNEPQVRWLWVGMEPRPTQVRVYLYCCKAGPRLSEFLHGCECIGHADSVPMPTAPDMEVVLDYLGAVDFLMAQDQFEPVSWREHLQNFVAERLEIAMEEATERDWRAIPAWAMLARSLA